MISERDKVLNSSLSGCQHDFIEDDRTLTRRKQSTRRENNGMTWAEYQAEAKYMPREWDD